MKLSHLVWREISHRRLNFVLMLMSVVVAVTCGVCVVTMLRGQELYNQNQVSTLDDEIRKITKNMGFNILILPKDQNLAEFYADDYAAQTMPETYVEDLAQNETIFTIQHLRPALIRKLDWPEQNRKIVLMGVRGVVPFAHRAAKKPLANPVPQGKIDVGHLLAEELQLEPGKQLTLLGETFEVNTVHPARGNKDDITLWIDLTKAQQLLELTGQINIIQALECNCSSIDRLAEIEAEISGVLGDQVQVVELATKAIARAKARTQISQQGIVRLERWKKIASAIIPLTAVGAGLLVGLLSLANLRQRNQEIGILRALGMRASQILRVLLAKPAMVGILGSWIGYLGGFGVAVTLESIWRIEDLSGSLAHSLFMLPLLVLVFVVTPILTVMAGWLPAFYAVSQDPAIILHDE